MWSNKTKVVLTKRGLRSFIKHPWLVLRSRLRNSTSVKFYFDRLLLHSLVGTKIHMNTVCYMLTCNNHSITFSYRALISLVHLIQILEAMSFSKEWAAE